MPYIWSKTDTQETELRLWPHQSLPPSGTAAFVLATFCFTCIPLLGLVGTVLLWALLPFMLSAVGGIWLALSKSHADRSILEVLTLDPSDIRLTRSAPKHNSKTWECNVYWAKITLHTKAGPIPNYVTLSGNGREVEIGAFLSEEERRSLFLELRETLATRRASKTRD